MDDERAYLEDDDDDPDAILATLADAARPDEERAAAAIRLGPLVELHGTGEVDDEVFEQIGKALWAGLESETEPELVRRRCLEALVRDFDERLAAQVRAALDRPGRWSITGIFAAGFVPGFDDDIRAAVASADLDERFEAWRAAGRRELHDLEGAAIRVARDPASGEELRLAAIEALETLDDGEDLGFTALDDLTSDPDPTIAEAAEAALAERMLVQQLGGSFEDES